MSEFFSSATLIDMVIAFTVLEGLAMSIYHRRTGRGLPGPDHLANLMAGLCLMLALRGAVTGAGWPWVALMLLAAGVSHGADLWQRLRR